MRRTVAPVERWREMRYAFTLAVLGLLGGMALGAIACGSTEAKPSQPVVYPSTLAYTQPVVFSGVGQYQGYGGQSQPSISISGEGRATAAPDVARIRVSISVRAPTAAEARDEGKAAINRLLDTVSGFDVEGQDVETRSFRISPITKRDEKTDERRIVEYQLHNVSEVTLRDVERVGELLDELVSNVGDALRINTISLAIEDSTEILRQAREKAMLDAQAKAQQLAELSGVQLGPPFSISESSERDPSGLLAKEVLVAPVTEGLEPDSVGELEADVSVFVVYSLIAE